MKQLSNESGITLIEVLAAITITAIIGSVVYGVLFQTIHARDKTQSHINLRQEANIVMTQLRMMHENNETLYYNSDMMYKDASKATSLTTEQYHFVEAQIKNLENSNLMQIDKNSITTKNFSLPSKSTLDVSFIIADYIGNEYKLETILPSETNLAIDSKVEKPTKVHEFYTYLASNNVFVYGSTFDMFGSIVNGTGTIVINNENKKDLIFDGNQKNDINISNVYIDKTNNNVIFDKNTKLGTKGQTEVVSIKGNVELNHGGGVIEADIVYIDGNVLLDNGAKISGRIVIITGNVNSIKNIDATEKLYVGGDVTPDILSNYPQINISSINIPELRDVTWYSAHDYKSSNNLESNMKYFMNSESSILNTSQDLNNVIIVVQGNITLNMGSGNFSGVIFAPNGSVTFNGDSFKGVVIAKNGFFVADRNPKPVITFTNITEYITDVNNLPFQ